MAWSKTKFTPLALHFLSVKAALASSSQEKRVSVGRENFRATFSMRAAVPGLVRPCLFPRQGRPYHADGNRFAVGDSFIVMKPLDGMAQGVAKV